MQVRKRSDCAERIRTSAERALVVLINDLPRTSKLEAGRMPWIMVVYSICEGLVGVRDQRTWSPSSCRSTP